MIIIVIIIIMIRDGDKHWGIFYQGMTIKQSRKFVFAETGSGPKP